MDRSLLERIVVRCSLLVADMPRIKEADINPLLASPDGITALDARLVLHDRHVRDENLPRTAIRPYPSAYLKKWMTRNGLTLTIRPIRPEDDPRMVRFHESLSDRSLPEIFHQMDLSARVTHERGLERNCFVACFRWLEMKGSIASSGKSCLRTVRCSRYAVSLDSRCVTQSRQVSRIRKGVRNADPTVWSVLEAVGRIYNARREQLQANRNKVGIILYGNAFPKITAMKVIEEIRHHNRVSPVVFINANAGAAISVCCTKFGFRGPTVNLTMCVEAAVAIVDLLAARWLRGGQAKYLFLVAADFDQRESVSVDSSLVRQVDSIP